MKEANLLTFYCQNNNTRGVVSLLKQNLDFDLTMREGICFFFAIKYNNVEMLNNLLDYYQNRSLQGKHDSIEYKTANCKLKQILRESVDSLDHVSPEIFGILAPYITAAEDNDDEEVLSDFEHYDVDKPNSNISVLDLSSNNLGDIEAEALAAKIRDNVSLTSLSLGYNNIGAAGAQALAAAIKDNGSLTSLDLSGNSIGDTGAQALAEAIRDNRSLMSLDLSRNDIGNSGAHAIAEAIKDNGSLTSLSLGYNNIGDAGAAALVGAIKDNSSLISMDFKRNNLGDTGAEALAGVIRNNHSLTSLNLWGNQIGEAGAQALARAIEDNHSLALLDLMENNIGDAGAEAMNLIEGYLTRNLNNKVVEEKQEQGQRLAELEAQIAGDQVAVIVTKNIELRAQIQAITKQLKQEERNNRQELVEQLATQLEELQAKSAYQNNSMMDRLINLAEASSEQSEIRNRFEELRQRNEQLYKYCSTICIELISYFKTYQILATGLVEGSNLNNLSDNSNFSNIGNLINGIGNVGFKVVTNIVDHYTLDLLSTASKTGEQVEKSKTDNQITKINSVINSKLLTPAMELNIDIIQELALHLVEIRKDKVLALATTPTEQAAGGTVLLRTVDNMLGSIKGKLIPILTRYPSAEEQLAARDALMVLGYICDNYNSIEQSNEALAEFFNSWLFKELEVCSQMQEPLAKVMKAAGENKWDEGGRIKIRKNIAGRLEEEYLREKLGSLYNEENVEITRMLYFAMINKGIMISKHQNQGLIEIFKVRYPDLTEKIAEEHPEYFMGNTEAMQICGCSAISTRDPIISGKGLEQHVQSDLDYWYEYSKPAMDELFKLRIEAAGIIETGAIIVPAAGPWYGYDAGSIEVINKLVQDITEAVNGNLAGEENKQATVLTALNLSNKHWVGVIVEKLKGGHLLISYIDPEQQEIAAPLKEALLTGFRLANSGANVDFSQLMTETQSYDNCGPEVIENILQYLCGYRVSQEDSVYIHSILLEQVLLGTDEYVEVGT